MDADADKVEEKVIPEESKNASVEADAETVVPDKDADAVADIGFKILVLMAVRRSGALVCMLFTFCEDRYVGHVAVAVSDGEYMCEEISEFGIAVTDGEYICEEISEFGIAAGIPD